MTTRVRSLVVRGESEDHAAKSPRTRHLPSAAEHDPMRLSTAAPTNGPPGPGGQHKLLDTIEFESSPRLAVQRRLFESISNSPRMVAQRAFVADLDTSPRQTAQRQTTPSLARADTPRPALDQGAPSSATGLPDKLKAGIESFSGGTANWVDNRSESICQRQLADMIHNSPYIVAQRRSSGAMLGLVNK